MLKRRDKYKLRESLKKINQVLVDTWDPIGVGDLEGWADDEYEAYVGPVYPILFRGGVGAVDK